MLICKGYGNDAGLILGTMSGITYYSSSFASIFCEHKTSKKDFKTPLKQIDLL